MTLLRVVALRRGRGLARARTCADDRPDVARLADRQLPVYTVLVPLFREANVLPGLVQSLRALDYPRAKLEILLVLEADDTGDAGGAAGAAAAGQLPHHRRAATRRRTPSPRRSTTRCSSRAASTWWCTTPRIGRSPTSCGARWTTFRRNPPVLGCVQAQLNIYNPRDSWFTRQFTIEYSALFDAILPALARLGLPVPLGGTSNHFPRETLIAAGGWDPFNVTEDADLGFRLARQGWRTAVLASTTWEEAPVAFGQWFRQRTRWLKGWMQTYLVHTRQPWRLNAELGPRGAVGFHALMGGLILSALVHPLFYVLLVYHVLSGQLLAPADWVAGPVFWSVACVNLAVGYVASILVGALSVWRRGRRSLALSALFMPICWLLVSAAAYRALYHLLRHPYLWEKTEHGLARRTSGRRPRSSAMRQRKARRRPGFDLGLGGNVRKVVPRRSS